MTFTDRLKQPLKHWKALINPLIMVLCLLLMMRIGFTGDPLFTSEAAGLFVQGVVPEVRYNPSPRLWLLICSLVVFNVAFFLTLTQWARYFLNRKLILSYLYFAIVPLLTVLLICLAAVRTWFGISNTLNIERKMDRQAQELQNFVQVIHSNIRDAGIMENPEAMVREIIDQSRDRELLSQRNTPLSDIPVEIYLVPDKRPGELQSILPLYLPSDHKLSVTKIYEENTPGFEEIYPSWLRKDKWTDIVLKDDRLGIRHFSAEPFLEGTSLIVQATIPVDKRFLNLVREGQAVSITMTYDNQNRVIASESGQGQWLTRLLLRPLSSKWDFLALDWHSGYYRDQGRLLFEFDFSQIPGAGKNNWQIHFFHTDQKNYAFRFIIGLVLFLVLGQLLAMAFGFYLVRYITRSLNLIAEGHEQITAGDLSYRLPYIGRDQLGSMGRSFNSMVSSIETLMREAEEKQRYQQELRIARDIQMSLLPNLQALAWCDNIAADCIPAREVGGDYYEVLRAGANKVGIFIADVSGKGTSAAFYMAELKGVLIALRDLWSKPRELMLSMNDILRPALQSNVFISAAYLLLDPDQQMGHLVRAGHCPSFLVQRDGTVVDLMPAGIAIGLADNHVFGKILALESFPMAAEDKVLLYTDGLDEMTFHNEMYGTKRLKQILSDKAGEDVQGLRDAILRDVLDFLSSESQNDDLTLVVAGMPAQNRDQQQPQTKAS